MSRRTSASKNTNAPPAINPSKVAVVIIPDAYSVPAQYERVASYCRSFGSEIVVVQNPSTASVGTLYDDASNARHHVQALVQRGKEVMILGHGYGAMVASQCCQGLTRDDMMSRRHSGGIVRLLFIAGIIATEGQSALQALGGMDGGGPPDGIADGFGWYSPERLAATHYTSALPGEALRHAAYNTPQSAQSLMDPLTFAGYRYVPVTYMITDADIMLPAMLQETYISLIEGVSGQIVDALHYPTDHFPSVTKPEAVIDCIRRAAGEELFESCTWI